MYTPGPEDCHDPLMPAHAEALLYMRRVEDHTSSYSLFAKLNPQLQGDVIYAGQVALWEYQEWCHAEQLSRIITFLEPDAMDRRSDRMVQQRERDAIGRFTRPLGAMGLIAAVGPDIASAVVAVRGYFNELTTGYGYSMLLELADHPLLDKTLPNIRKEETMHATLYKERALEKLDGSKTAQRVVRMILSRKPTIVGEEYRGTAEADIVIKTLFANKRFADIAERIDSNLANLPGMKGLAPMQRRVRQAMSF
jgi:hypothetical protein